MRPARVLSSAVLGALAWFTVRRCLYVAAMLATPRATTAVGDEALPSITLIVPARNEEAVLWRALESIDRLDYPRDRLAVLLVDHGSHDRTAAILGDWARFRPRARALELEAGGGKGRALNAALQLADGELVGVLDADLRPRPDALRRLATVFAAPEVGAAAAFVAPANATATLVSRYAAIDTWVHELVSSAGKDRLRLDPPTYGASLYRRAALLQAGGFPEDGFHEDLAAGLAVASLGWRTRFVAGAVVDNWVVETLRDYWRQHVRWTRGPFDAAQRRPGRPSLVRRLEAWTLYVGYGDRLAFLACLPLAWLRLVPRWVPAAYLAVPALQVALAVGRAEGARALPRYLPATVLFPVDVAASLAAVAGHVLRRRRQWHPRGGARAPQATARSRGRRRPSRNPSNRPVS